MAPSEIRQLPAFPATWGRRSGGSGPRTDDGNRKHGSGSTRKAGYVVQQIETSGENLTQKLGDTSKTDLRAKALA